MDLAFHPGSERGSESGSEEEDMGVDEITKGVNLEPKEQAKG